MAVQKKARLINFSVKILQLLFRLFLRYVDGRLPQYMWLYSKYLKLLGVRVDGLPKYICSDLRIDSSDYGIISIGSEVVISSEVRILTHDYSVSGAIDIFKPEKDFGEIRKIDKVIFEKGSFIGLRCTIMPGVIIGEGAIVGACSVVTKNVEPYTVVAGNPARLICSKKAYYEKVSLQFKKNPLIFFRD